MEPLFIEDSGGQQNIRLHWYRIERTKTKKQYLNNESSDCIVTFGKSDALTLVNLCKSQVLWYPTIISWLQWGVPLAPACRWATHLGYPDTYESFSHHKVHSFLWHSKYKLQHFYCYWYWWIFVLLCTYTDHPDTHPPTCGAQNSITLLSVWLHHHKLYCCYLLPNHSWWFIQLSS